MLRVSAFLSSPHRGQDCGSQTSDATSIYRRQDAGTELRRSGQNVPNTHLKWETFVTPSILVVTTDFAPGEHPWPPIASPLIYGVRDAVMVDSFIPVEQARAQADWIAAKGKNLT